MHTSCPTLTFVEQNQMKQEQVDKIPEIYALLESKNLADAITRLKDLHLIKDHKDYKKASKAIKNFQQDVKRQQKKASTTAVVSMFDAIVNNQKIDQDLVPSSLQKVFSNNFDNRDKESMHEYPDLHHSHQVVFKKYKSNHQNYEDSYIVFCFSDNFQCLLVENF